MKNYYQILGLPFGASLVEIKSAYRKLAFQFHPDKNKDDTHAQEKFIEITDAYDVLTNKDKSYFYHIEYTDYLNNRPTKQSTVFQDYHKDPKQYPRKPVAKASEREIDVKAVFISFLIFVGILFYAFFLTKNRRKELTTNNISEFNSTPEKKKYHLSKDEYYLLVSQDFINTHDSTLMKIENVDSVIKVLDSLINLPYQ